MIVMKFGGTSVQDAEAIARVREIVRSRLEERPLVVVSAMSKVTRLLCEMAEAAGRGEKEKTDALLDALLERHHTVAEDLLADDAELFMQTIVRIDGQNELTLLRPGGITPEQLGEFARVSLSPAVLDKLKEGERVQSPGMKYKHYAPKTPLYLLRGDGEARKRFLSGQTGKFAVLAYTGDVEVIRAYPASPVVFDLGDENNPAERLHRLFYLLREADKAGCERIYAPLPGTDGLSLALYNRMIRAAAYQIISL